MSDTRNFRFLYLTVLISLSHQPINICCISHNHLGRLTIDIFQSLIIEMEPEANVSPSYQPASIQGDYSNKIHNKKFEIIVVSVILKYHILQNKPVISNV